LYIFGSDIYILEVSGMPKLQWIWFSLLKINAARKAALLGMFPSVDAIYAASREEYRAKGITDEKALVELCEKSLASAERVLELCAKTGIKTVAIDELSYPDRLKNIDDPPSVLYYKGNLPVFDAEPAIAVVGSRSHTAYGRLAAERLAYEIAAGGGYVVSGMARGIDSAAHRGALKAGRPTAAVLGSGPDVVYPRENAGLYEEIISNGCVISEYPPRTQPLAFHFPERNRIVSGLSLAVLVVEAGRRSGALITANIAADQGRDVFAVPGNIDVPESEGTNDLIKAGAKLVSTGWDVLSEYAGLFPSLTESRKNGEKSPDCRMDLPKGFTDAQSKIILSIAKKPLHLDEIISICGLSASEALAELTVLEIEGAVTQLPGKRFAAGTSI